MAANHRQPNVIERLMTNGTLNHQAALHNLYNRELENYDAIIDMSAFSGDIFALTARNIVEIDVNCSRIGMPTFVVFVQFSNGQDSKRNKTIDRHGQLPLVANIE